MRLKISALIMGLVIALGGASLAKAASTEIWNTTGITSLSHNTLPQLKGRCLVWQARGGLGSATSGSGDWEVFLYDTESHVVTQITDDDWDDHNPRTDGTYIVWWADKASGAEVWLCNTQTGVQTQISPAGGENENHVFPVIANGRIAWLRSVFRAADVLPEDRLVEVFLYDTLNAPYPRQLTQSTLTDNVYPGWLRINDQWLMWTQVNETDPQDEGTAYVDDFNPDPSDDEYPAPVPAGLSWEGSPQEDGNLTVSTKYDGQDWEIVLRGGPQGLEQITDNGIDDRSPQISEGNIAWMAGDGEMSEIYLAEFTLCDNTPITGSVSPSVDTLWPPNHSMIQVTIDASALVTHNTDTQISIASVDIAECSSEEAGENYGENTYDENDYEPDWEITGNLTVNLRSERSGASTGRTYTITVTASDCSGAYNFTAEVVVPHDKGK
jgi:hypothetical protein